MQYRINEVLTDYLPPFMLIILNLSNNLLNKFNNNVMLAMGKAVKPSNLCWIDSQSYVANIMINILSPRYLIIH